MFLQNRKNITHKENEICHAIVNEQRQQPKWWRVLSCREKVRRWKVNVYRETKVSRPREMHNKLTSGDTESGKQWDPFSDNKLQQLIWERERRGKKWPNSITKWLKLNQLIFLLTTMNVFIWLWSIIVFVLHVTSLLFDILYERRCHGTDSLLAAHYKDVRDIALNAKASGFHCLWRRMSLLTGNKCL